MAIVHNLYQSDLVLAVKPRLKAKSFFDKSINNAYFTWYSQWDFERL